MTFEWMRSVREKNHISWLQMELKSDLFISFEIPFSKLAYCKRRKVRLWSDEIRKLGSAMMITFCCTDGGKESEEEEDLSK